MHVVHDERAAAFVALGLGLGGVPAVLVSTSGTAAVNFHPAVVEADLSRRPDDRRHRRPPARAARRRRPADDRPDPSLRALGAVVPRPGGGRPGARADVAVARPPGDRGRGDRAGAPQPAVPRPARRPARPVAAGGDGRQRRRSRRPGRRAVAGGPRRRARSGAGRDPRRRSQRRRSRRRGRARRGDAVAGPRRPDVGRPRRRRCGRGVRRAAAAPASSPPTTRRTSSCASDDRPPRRCSPSGSGGSGATLVQVGGPGQIDPDHGVAVRLDPGTLPTLAAKLRGATGTPWLARWRHAAERAEAAIDARARRATGAHRAGGGARRRPVPSAGRRTGRRLLDAGARPRVVRRPDGAGPRQPGRQRHRRRGLDGPRRRPRRRTDGRPRR